MRSFILLVLVIALTPAMAFAANEGGNRNTVTLSGTVLNSLGQPLAGALVTLKRIDGRVVARAVSDEQGHFSFTGVPAGKYIVSAGKRAFRVATAVATVARGPSTSVILTLESQEALSLRVVATRLDKARNGLSTQTGGSVYRFSEKALQDLPQGNNTPLNQVLLQAPGVAQDSFGQIHVRGEHADLQYRINGVQLPEGITGFGQVLSPRMAQSVNFLTGALPAQYGYRTAGVIDIHTKTGVALSGGDIDMYGGQHTTLNPSFEVGGTKGNLDYFGTGQYFQSALGLEPPTPGPAAYHDQTYQGNGFGYLSYILNPNQRLSLFTGMAVNHFQIADNPNQPQVFPLSGVPFYPSANLNENQLEQNYYGVLALQGTIGTKFDYQLSPFSRYSTLSFYPDTSGDLIFNGAASRIFRSNWANGIQGDSSYRLTGTHTVRAGFWFSGEKAEIDNHELTFPLNMMGVPLTVPILIVDDKAITAWLYGIYLQDEWRPTEKLTINYGARFDLYDGLVRADQASPRVGMVYKLFPKTTVHAAYARYFAPPPTELVTTETIARFLGTTGAPNSTFAGNPSPERSHYFDVGVIQDILPGLTVGIDSYYKKSTDLIDEGQFGPAILFSTFNYRKGRAWGAEFTGTYNRPNLTTYANFAYSVAQGTQVESGQFNFTPDTLAYIKTHYIFLDHDQTYTSSVGAAYRWNGFSFLFDGIYESGLREAFANTRNLPYHIQVNVGVTKDFTLPKIGDVQGRISVINLFDRTYQIRSGNGIGVFAPQFGPRRAFYAGLKWEIPFLKAPEIAAQ